MALPVNMLSGVGVLEYWSIRTREKGKAKNCIIRLKKLFHYSTTPLLQLTDAKWKDHGSPLWGQIKACPVRGNPQPGSNR